MLSTTKIGNNPKRDPKARDNRHTEREKATMKTGGKPT